VLICSAAPWSQLRKLCVMPRWTIINSRHRLVGGSTRIPKVQKTASRLLQWKGTEQVINPMKLWRTELPSKLQFWVEYKIRPFKRALWCTPLSLGNRDSWWSHDQDHWAQLPHSMQTEQNIHTYRTTSLQSQSSVRGRTHHDEGQQSARHIQPHWDSTSASRLPQIEVTLTSTQMES